MTVDDTEMMPEALPQSLMIRAVKHDDLLVEMLNKLEGRFNWPTLGACANDVGRTMLRILQDVRSSHKVVQNEFAATRPGMDYLKVHPEVYENIYGEFIGLCHSPHWITAMCHFALYHTTRTWTGEQIAHMAIHRAAQAASEFNIMALWEIRRSEYKRLTDEQEETAQEAQAADQPQKPRRGRPPGSKNGNRAAEVQSVGAVEAGEDVED